MGIHVRLDDIHLEDSNSIHMSQELRHDINEVNKFSEPRRVLFVKEMYGEGNPHVHMYLDTKKSRDAVKCWITRNLPKYVKDQKCVKIWGDKDPDMWYFCKGKDCHTLPLVIQTTFSHEKIVEFHKNYWQNPSDPSTSLTDRLLHMCKHKGIKDSRGVIEEFIGWRKGKEPICEMKHGGVIKSVWLALQEEGSRDVEMFVDHMHQRIFGY